MSHGPAALLYVHVLRTGLTSMRPSHRCTKRYIRVFLPLWLPFCSPDLVEVELFILFDSLIRVALPGYCGYTLSLPRYFHKLSTSSESGGADPRIQVVLALISVHAPRSRMTREVLMELRTA
jgi:hypothetical protein